MTCDRIEHIAFVVGKKKDGQIVKFGGGDRYVDQLRDKRMLRNRHKNKLECYRTTLWTVLVIVQCQMAGWN